MTICADLDPASQSVTLEQADERTPLVECNVCWQFAGAALPPAGANTAASETSRSLQRVFWDLCGHQMAPSGGCYSPDHRPVTNKQSLDQGPYMDPDAALRLPGQACFAPMHIRSKTNQDGQVSNRKKKKKPSRGVHRISGGRASIVR